VSTASTASSSTDGNPPDDASELDRRGFFRAFGRQTVQAAGSLAGALDAVRRGGTAAAGELLNLGLGDPDANAQRLSGVPGALEPSLTPADTGFRSPYRLVGDTLFLLDQRGIPGAAPDVECRTANDVAAAMRNGVVRGGPVLAQVAAYGIALTAARAVEGPEHRRLSRIRTQAAGIRAARPSARPVRWAVARMTARLEAVATSPSRRDVAEALRAEADAIATEIAAAHAAIGRHGASLLRRPDDGSSLHVLLHGNAGALAGGLVGTALAVVAGAAAGGRSVEAWVTETRPTLEGSRLTAWELARSDIPTTVLPDAAVAWLLERERIDVVLLGAEWIAANGDVANVIGSRTVAAMAFRHRVPVLVCAPLATVDLGTADGWAIPEEHRPPSEVLRLPSGGWPSHLGAVFAPVNDIVPAPLVTALVTEAGALGAPYGPALQAALGTGAS
jgi:methylthioribose-1-phosphate isomerase